ncbi:hypothetical protein [Mycobacterium marseillense]|uniref:hypothetical protein n=1 Tax=Mycobacterium marseillense TaxID=701042 RepID=UPI000A4F0067|nr:hypothetical protein [Mycobacterium marseillense]
MDDELRQQVRHLTDRSERYDCMQRCARGIDWQDRALAAFRPPSGVIDQASART